jgi:hypothetical protein
MEIDPSPARPNDELEFIELTGIDDYALDQELAGLYTEGIRDLRHMPSVTKNASESVLMLLARQLPTQLEFRFNRTSELEGAAYERLLDLLDEAMQSGKYSKVRRLRMSFSSLRHLEWTNSIQRDVAKKSSRAGSIQRAC